MSSKKPGSLKRAILGIPLLGPAVRAAVRFRRGKRVAAMGSADYWRERYRLGGNSGPGSRGQLAAYKAGFLNEFVEKENVTRVLEFGCGDGYQLSLATYPHYVGYDISEEAVDLCRARFAGDATKRFLTLPRDHIERGDLTLSLDVVYHLVEDDVFENYMHDLFEASTRFVIIYSSDSDSEEFSYSGYMKNRIFTAWVHENIAGFRLVSRIPNPYPMKGDPASGSISDFFVYERE